MSRYEFLKKLGLRAPSDHFETVVAANHVTLLHNDECFEPMLEAIDAAVREVLIEMYWFDSSPIGEKFATALIECAKRGVRVCVVYDSVGSLDADPAMFDRMRNAGCEVEEWNPVHPWRRRFSLRGVNQRDHRKIIVVDNWTGFTGGFNIGRPWMATCDGGGGFRDDTIRIEGPAVSQLRELFRRTWRTFRGVKPLSERPSAGALAPSAGDSPVRVLASRQVGQRRAIRRTYLEQIRGAKKYLYITNSYFCPDRAVRFALYKAARRGVDVRILLPYETDVKVMQLAGRFLYTFLLEAGIRVYEWRGSVLHSKTAVIDDHWATVGSYNLDHRSWRYNLEVNVAVEDPSVAKAIRARFERDLEGSTEVTLESWRKRPVFERFLQAFVYLFHKLL